MRRGWRGVYSSGALIKPNQSTLTEIAPVRLSLSPEHDVGAQDVFAAVGHHRAFVRQGVIEDQRHTFFGPCLEVVEVGAAAFKVAVEVYHEGHPAFLAYSLHLAADVPLELLQVLVAIEPEFGIEAASAPPLNACSCI
jgi:hypothetical protein